MPSPRNPSERFPRDPNAPRPRPVPNTIGATAGAELRRLVYGDPEPEPERP